MGTSPNIIHRLACIFVIVFFVSEPKINVIGVEEADSGLNKLGIDYFQVSEDGVATVLPNIWNTHSIRYIRKPDNVTTIIYSGPYKQGWMGFGFSKTGGMIGSSAMVGWVGEGGKNMIKQYSLQGYTPAKVVPNKGEIQLTKVTPESIFAKGTLHMAFQFTLPSDSTKQKVIFASSPNSPKGDVLTFHKEVTMKEIDFSKGEVDNTASTLKAFHGTVAFLAWQVLIPVGIMFPVYFKYLDPQWFYLHMSIQFTGYILAFATVLLGYRVSHDMNRDWGIHRYIGSTALILATLQVLAVWLRPAKDSPSRGYWNKYHHSVGYIATLLALLNFVLGLRVGQAGLPLKIAFGVWYVAFNIFIFFVAPRISKRGAAETTQPPVFTPAAS